MATELTNQFNQTVTNIIHIYLNDPNNSVPNNIKTQFLAYSYSNNLSCCNICSGNVYFDALSCRLLKCELEKQTNR